MKIKACLALLLLLASIPAWSAGARKITVAELKDLLQTMHQQKKGDADVATALKQVQLSEQLTRAVMNSLVDNVPGQLSTEQMYVLEARSALLPPPAADVPSNPPLDAAAQQALLTKASAYASGAYAQLPSLSAVRTTLRFLDKGQETLPADKTQWGRNKMIQIMDPDPNVGAVISEANASGGLQFVRWENVNGKPAAVFSYAVNKKKSHMGVHVCCFPDIDQAGSVRFSGQMGTGMPGGSASSGGGATGNLQTVTSWSLYKKDGVPYHGQIFIDPDTGIVVRMITQTEEKNTDMVHQDDERIDYAPVTVGGKALVLPVRAVTITEVVPNGEAGAGGFSTRTTLFTTEFKDYQQK
jgi:hypothetical protein